MVSCLITSGFAIKSSEIRHGIRAPRAQPLVSCAAATLFLATNLQISTLPEARVAKAKSGTMYSVILYNPNVHSQEA